MALTDSFVVGLGSNLGARLATMRAAALMIDALDACHVVARSPVVETPAVGPPQPAYLNAAVRVETSLSPLELLEQLLRIERELGRERRERWGARTIDLDVLWRRSGAVDEPRLCVPHPHLFERAFALAPLVAVAEPPVPAAEEVLSKLGAPRVVGTLDAPRARAWRSLDDGSVELEVARDDSPETLAVLAELAGRGNLGPESPGASAREVLEVRCKPSARAIVQAVLASCDAGFSVAAVTLSHIDADVASCRIVGIRSPARPDRTSVELRAVPGAWAARIVRAKVSEICGPKH